MGNKHSIPPVTTEKNVPVRYTLPFQLFVGLKKPNRTTVNVIEIYYKDISVWKPVLDQVMSNAYNLCAGKSRRVKVGDIGIYISKMDEYDAIYDGFISWSAVNVSPIHIDTFVDAFIGDQLRGTLHLHKDGIETYILPKNVLVG